MSFNTTPQVIDPAALMAKVSTATVPEGGQFPFIVEGTHSLLLANYEQKATDKGPKVFAYFVYMKSNNPAVLVGSLCSKMWSMHAGKFPDSLDKEIGAMRGFIQELQGTKEEAQIAAAGLAMLSQNAGRGIVIECTGVMNSKGNFVYTNFAHTAGQTAASITACRAHLDTVAPMALFAANAAAAPPADAFAAPAAVAPVAAQPFAAAAPAAAVAPVQPMGVAPVAAVPVATNFLGGAPAAAPAAAPVAATGLASMGLDIPGL